MTDEPFPFLVNLAILKINWDQSHDILHNFMPLVGYAIRQLEHDVVSVDELKETIDRVAQFRIPSGALEVLVRRAAKPRYGYVVRKDKTFRRVPERLSSLEFEKDRESATRQFRDISRAFAEFCNSHFPGVEFTDTSAAFFEILYDVAPRVVGSAARFIQDDVATTAGQALTLRYRAARFINNAIEEDASYLPNIETFFQGAVLAESFYYSSPDAVHRKFKNVKVFYDTNLLSKILGYSSNSEVLAATELHDLVLEAGAKTTIFEHTREELHRIFTAASYSRRYGPLKPQKPGDIFDWLNRRGYSASDIELEIARIPDRLEAVGIKIESTRPHIEELEIGEAELKRYIQDEIPTIGGSALNADVDSLSGIFRIRDGRAQYYLDSCKAILVTTNTGLAIASSKYFNAEHAISNAPVCITDHVFCMLVWLKTVDKKSNIPRELMVANCIAALQPTRELWDRYMSEVERLRIRGDVTEADYALLTHSLEARQALMDITSGDSDVFLSGSAVEVLEAAKSALTAETRAQLEEKSAELLQKDAALIDAKEREARLAERNRENLEHNNLKIINIRNRIASLIYALISLILLVAIAVALFVTQGVNGYEYFSNRLNWDKSLTAGDWQYILWAAVFFAGVINLIFGWAIATPARALARAFANRLVGLPKVAAKPEV